MEINLMGITCSAMANLLPEDGVVQYYGKIFDPVVRLKPI